MTSLLWNYASLFIFVHRLLSTISAFLMLSNLLFRKLLLSANLLERCLFYTINKHFISSLFLSYNSIHNSGRYIYLQSVKYAKRFEIYKLCFITYKWFVKSIANLYIAILISILTIDQLLVYDITHNYMFIRVFLNWFVYWLMLLTYQWIFADVLR